MNLSRLKQKLRAATSFIWKAIRKGTARAQPADKVLLNQTEAGSTDRTANPDQLEQLPPNANNANDTSNINSINNTENANDNHKSEARNDADNTNDTSKTSDIDHTNVPIRDLWNLAYENLRKEDGRLIDDYEAKIRKNLSADVGCTIGSNLSRRDWMEKILQEKMKEVNNNAWRIRFGSSETQFKDMANNVLGVVNWANEYITDALRPNPYASMAWAGVSLLLPLFLNASKQAASQAKGLQDISSLIAQSRLREDLYYRRTEAKARVPHQEPPLSHQLYKDSLEVLYREILRFQAKSYYHYASSGPLRLGQDMVKWEDWDKLLDRVIDSERKFAAVEALWRDLKYDEECSATERRYQESLRQWNEMRTDLSSLHRAVEHARTDNARRKLLTWLCDVDPSEMYNAARDKHAADTGEWLTGKSEEFKAWESSPSSFLWLHGKAGSGKSILSSVVIKHLKDQHASNPSTALAFFYFSFSDVKKQRVGQMLASLVQQLCARRPDTPQPIQSLKEYQEKGQRPDTKTLESILVAVATGFSAVHIVIDALDECPTSQGERKMLLQSLHRIMTAAPANVHICCTSRNEADINTAVIDLLSLPLNAAVIDLTAQKDILDQDIGSFIDSTLASWDFQSWPDDTKAKARRSLIDKADGMFQYVFFQLEALQKFSSSDKVLEALHDLPRGLDATYDRLLQSLDMTFQSNIISCLKWLAFSNEVLKLEQLAEIFMLHPERGPSLDNSERLFKPKVVLNYLSSLIVLQEVKDEYRTYTNIRLAHFSVKEYLLSSRILNGPGKDFAFTEEDAHLHIAHSCLAYHLQRSAMAEKETKHLELKYYAATEWPWHLEKAPRASWPDKVMQAAARALAIRSRSLDHQLLRYQYEYRLGSHAHMSLRPQCYTARQGFLQLTDMLLSRDTGVNRYLTRKDLNAALHDAAYGGHMKVVQLCLDKRADVNSKSDVYGDALQAAANGGHAAIVSLLLNQGADIDAQRGGWGSALQAAAEGEKLDILRLLVGRGASIDLPSNESGCVLTSAVAASNRLPWSSCDCLLYLLDAGADINRQGGGIHGTALHEAAMGLPITDTAFHVLLERGADVNAPGGKYGFPLQAACAKSDNEEHVKLLLDTGADVNAQGGKYGNALQAACHYDLPESTKMPENTRVLEQLIDRGADVNAQGGRLGTALQAACASGCRGGIVNILLANGADVNIHGGKYGIALNAACLADRRYWDQLHSHYDGSAFWKLSPRGRSIRRLLDRGAEANAPPCSCCPTALQAACKGGMIAVVRMLLAHGADVKVQGGKYGTALQAACTAEDAYYGMAFFGVDIFKLLLERGADVHARGGFYGSAWHAAATHLSSLREENVLLQQLLDLGVDINDAGGTQHPTALHAVVASGWEDYFWENRILFLLQRGADPNLAAGEYGSPLQLACAMQVDQPLSSARSTDRAIFLLENADLDVNKQGGLFGSALQAAAWTGKARVVRVLLDKGAHVNLRGGKYGSAINAAVLKGYYDIVEMLLKQGATPDCHQLQGIDKAWLQEVEDECGEEAVERYRLFWEGQKSCM
ncbi:ankyrin repeat-containing domain protein [Trichoderma gracile]